MARGKNGIHLVEKGNHFPKLHRKFMEAAAQNIIDTTEELANEYESAGWVANMPISTEFNGLLGIIHIGSRRKFYSGFLEFGTVFQPPDPQVIPRANAKRDDFLRKAKSIERRMNFT